MVATRIASGAGKASHSEGAGAHVLLVEDDDELREALAETLRLNGMTVSEAESGAAFRDALRAGDVEVAIIDVNLPDISGFMLARDLAAAPRRPGIIMLTLAARHDRVRGYAEGADLYMTKPVDGEELVLAVGNMARRLRPRRSHRRTARPRPAGGWTCRVGGSSPRTARSSRCRAARCC